MSDAELTWVCLLQMFFQQAAVQEELKPGGLKRRAGPTAGHSSYPVCCLRTHPPLVESDKDLENTIMFKDLTVTRSEGEKELCPGTKLNLHQGSVYSWGRWLWGGGSWAYQYCRIWSNVSLRIMSYWCHPGRFHTEKTNAYSLKNKFITNNVLLLTFFLLETHGEIQYSVIPVVCAFIYNF